MGPTPRTSARRREVLDLLLLFWKKVNNEWKDENDVGSGRGPLRGERAAAVEELMRAGALARRLTSIARGSIPAASHRAPSGATATQPPEHRQPWTRRTHVSRAFAATSRHPLAPVCGALDDAMTSMTSRPSGGGGHHPAKRAKATTATAATTATTATPTPPRDADSSARDRFTAALAAELGLAPRHVRDAVALMDDEHTVPFIARYRKERTGGMDETTLRAVAARLVAADKLEARREAILAALLKRFGPGQIPRELEDAVRGAETSHALEDAYAPHKPKAAASRAATATARGLAPLAAAILDGEESAGASSIAARARAFLSDDVKTVEDAIAGASDIIAEAATSCVEARESARKALWRRGKLVVTEKKEKEKETTKAAKRVREQTRDYFGTERAVCAVPEHQVLAITRAEAAGVARVSFDWGKASPPNSPSRAARASVAPSFDRLPRDQRAIVERAIDDGVHRLLRPSIERWARGELRERALRRAVRDFGANLRALLLHPPMRPASVVVGVDPAFRTGCKLAAVDATGAVVATGVVYLQGFEPRGARTPGTPAPAALRAFVEAHGATAIAIGDGQGTREAEKLVADANLGDAVGWRVVSEAGASVYSASPLAVEELPSLDVSSRGAVSIARRLQDPLSELVKIDPQSLGVGLYQHDVKEAELAGELSAVVESAVAEAGVNVNTASA